MSGKLARVAAIRPPLEIIGSLSRSMICAAPGKVLISADFSAIESRVLAWLAGETWKLETYRAYDATGDPTLEAYCATASKILGRTVTPEDEVGRQVGKLCDLAYGFGGGAGAFNRIAADAGFSEYPHGDNVQTVEPWEPPDVWQDLDAARINRILDIIDAGLANGRRYSDAPRADDRAAWKIVLDEMPEKTEAQAREIINTWVRNGLLERKTYEDPAQRRDVKGLFVNQAKRPKAAAT